MTEDSLLFGLNDAQREAVTHRDKPLLVLAGPGSGKTLVVTRRVAWLLREGTAPWAILVLTFTNRAAVEMRLRLGTLVGENGVWMSTFHRFCAQLLRSYGDRVGLEPEYTIYDTHDSLAAVRRAAQRLREQEPSEFGDATYSAESLLQGLSTLKNRYLQWTDFQPEPFDRRGAFLKALAPIYQDSLRRGGAVDFDDLLLHTVRLLRENPDLRQRLDAQFQYILVDEYQDTNLAQYTISRFLATDVPNLMVTGDPDQSIYAWRGADVRNILEFERDYPDARQIRLEENYRSTPNILTVADHLIQHNIERHPKQLFTRRPAGNPVRLRSFSHAEAEAAWIAAEIAAAVHSGVREPKDFAIFYRVNALSVTLENALRQAQIPFRVVHGTAFLERAEVRDLLAYLRLLENPYDNEAFLRIVNVPTRGIGKTSLDRLSHFAWENGFSLWESACQADKILTLKKRSRAALASFVHLIFELHEMLSASESVAALVQGILDKTHYAEQFATDTESLFNEEDSQKRRNLEEFQTLAHQYDATAEHPSLRAFLEQNSLASDTDVLDSTENGVSLMTLHAGKGLEFPVVYITAIEHGILPHERATDDASALEEERRLLFVGMTRAKEELTLTHTEARMVAGLRRTVAPSRFLMELPLSDLDTTETLSKILRSDLDDTKNNIEHDIEYNQDTAYLEESSSEESFSEPDENFAPKRKSLPTLADIPGLMTAAELWKRKKS